MSITSRTKHLVNSSSGYQYIPFKNALQPYAFLLLISISLYLNTFKHEVAFDDEVVLHKNEFVMKGFKGIPSLLTHDSYYSYYKQLQSESSLPGGRYRPLSLITFAIEQQFIGIIPDGIVGPNSWDTNHNRLKDPKEDTNKDGLYTDYDFWVKGAGFRHVVNVLLYALLIGLIYRVLITYIFPTMKDMVFCAVLLFAVHPLHTEVVANIKSRDEILSLLFIFLTLSFALKYIKNFHRKDLVWTSVYMLLALLSKEYALLLFVMIPAILFVFYRDNLDLKESGFWILALLVLLASLALVKFFNAGTLVATPILFLYGGYYFSKRSRKASTRLIFALGSALVFYLSLRFSATIHQVSLASFSGDIIANPYLYATTEQLLASKIAVWLKYLELFFIPNGLIMDYSFSTIAYSDFQSIKVWLSIFIYSLLIILAIYTFFKRSSWSFGFMLLIGFFVPVANIFVDIGATMGERLFFHSSLGVCILVSLFFFSMIARFKSTQKSVVLFVGLMIIFQNSIYAFLTIKRNPDWKNNHALFIADSPKAPNNINMLVGASSAWYDLSVMPKNKAQRITYLQNSINLCNQGLKIYSNHIQFNYNKAISFYGLELFDSCLIESDKVLKRSRAFPAMNIMRSKVSDKWMLKGVEFFQKGDHKQGMQYLLKSVSANKANDKAWNNLGKALYDAGAKDKALVCFQSALKINPRNEVSKAAIVKIQSEVKQ